MHTDEPPVARCPICPAPDPECALCPDAGATAPPPPTATLVERRVRLAEVDYCPLGSP
jgi:hypothetical protein